MVARLTLGNMPDLRKKLANLQKTMQEFHDASEDGDMHETARSFAWSEFERLEEDEAKILAAMKEIRLMYPGMYRM